MRIFVKVNSNYAGVRGDQEGMGLDSNEFFESNETLPKDELEDLLGINSRTFRYYKENAFLKGRKPKKKDKNIFSQGDIELFNLIKVLRCTGLSLSAVKEIAGIRENSQVKSRKKLLRLYELLEEPLHKIEFSKRELEQLREDILGFKKNLQKFSNYQRGLLRPNGPKRTGLKLPRTNKMF